MDHNNEADLANAPYAFFQQDDAYGGHGLQYPPGPHMTYQVVTPQTPDVIGMRQLNLSLGHPGPNFSYPASPTRLAQNTHLPPSPSPVDTSSVYDHPISPPVSGSDTSTDGSTYHTPHHSYSRESSSPPSIRRSQGQHRFNPTGGHRRRRSSTNDEAEFSDDDQRSPMGSGQALAEHLSNSRKEATRKQRIEAEQRRRDELREGYARLKDVLPVTTQKSSKVSLLERATNYIVTIDGQNKVLNSRIAALELQVENLRRANERLAMTVTHHTGQVPTQEEMGMSLQSGYDDQQTPIEGRPLSPPPDVQPQVATPQAMPQHHHQHPHQEQEHISAHQHQHQPQLHQPHPHHQMYQHRNDSTASASGSEYSLN